MPLTTLQKYILLTLTYSAQFSFPLTAKEIWLRLLTKTSKKNARFTLEKSNLALKELVKMGVIETYRGYFGIQNIKDLVTSREKRLSASERKVQEAQAFLHELKSISWIKGVAITGSVAVNNAKENDDIDFLIVTETHRLWLTRLRVAFKALRHGKLRSWQSHEFNSWCFNLWLSEDSLEMPLYLRTAYGAYEVAQAAWIFDSTTIAKSFYLNNLWASSYIPNIIIQKLHNEAQIAPVRKKERVSDIFMYILEKSVYYAQKIYMSSHKSKEYVTEKVAFFHPRNTKKIVYDAWRNAIIQLKTNDIL